MRQTLFISLLVSLSLACGASGEDEDFDLDAPKDTAPPAADQRPQYGEWLFEPDVITTIEITIDNDDWDALRFQTRSFIGALAGDCQAQPFEKPWTYFPATVVVNGYTVENVGVRKKGFIGSLSATKPSLKIKFGEYVEGQKFSGLKRLTLNNQRQDPSLINACLGYSIFRDAGIVAPRCNFAQVTVNGVDLGIYAHVDSLRQDFVEQNFADDSGNLWEGTLSDFRDDWTGTFELKTNRETTPSDPVDIATAIDVPNGQLMASVSSVIDLDQFYTFWATETLVGHWDGHSGNTNNFYFYNNPKTGLAEFIPWGADALFRQRFTPYSSLQAAGTLTKRLYLHPEGQTAYLDRVVETLEAIWDEPALVAEVDRMSALVRPHVPAGALAQFDAEIAETRTYINGKQEAVTTELAGGPPVINGNLRADFCFDRIGDVSLSIDTLWNAGVANLGTGTVNFDIPGLSQTVVNVTSLAGPAGGGAVLYLSADLDDGSNLLFAMTMPLAEVKPGGLVEIDWLAATGEVYLTPSGGTQTLASRLAKGDISVSRRLDGRSRPRPTVSQRRPPRADAIACS